MIGNIIFDTLFVFFCFIASMIISNYFGNIGLIIAVILAFVLAIKIRVQNNTI